VVAGIVILFTILARLVMVERRVSRGYSELQRAEMAAQAGEADAKNILLYLFANFPDSVTFWDPKIADTATPGTVFMFRDRTPDKDTSATFTNPKIYARPLVSGAATKEFYPNNEFSETLPAGATTDPAKSVDFNETKRFGDGDENGWIGAVPGKTPVPVNVPWVEVLEDPAQARDMTIDPATGKPKNPTVARYAWWVEDESFKLNVNTAKAALRGSPDSESLAVNGKDEGDPKPSLRGLFADSSSPQNVAESIEAARNALAATGRRFLSPAQVGHSDTVPDDTTPLTFARDYKFLLTAESSGLNLSRTGAKRLNLNEEVERSLEGVPNDSTGHPNASEARGNIDKSVKRIIAAINAQTPHFGQRFYRLNTPDQLAPTISASAAAGKNALDVVATAANPHEQIYVRKIAANIYDALSPAVNPTLLVTGGKLLLGSPISSLIENEDLDFDPALIPSTTGKRNEIEAIGKKRNVPYFTEYGLVARVLSTTNRGATTQGQPICDFEFELDHYFEFWNLGDRPIRVADGDLGPSPYLVVENQPGVAANDDAQLDGQDIPAGRPFEIKLDDNFTYNGSSAKIEIPPGEAVVITTDPNYLTNAPLFALSGKRIYAATALYAPGTSIRCDQGISEPPYPPYSAEGSASVVMTNVRRYKCTSYRWKKDDSDHGELQFGPRMEGSTSTKIILGNAYGILDAHPSLAISKVTNANMIVFKPGSDGATHYRGSYVGGTRKGYFDPRGNLEAIDIRMDSGYTVTSDYSTLLPNGMSPINPDPPGNTKLGVIPTIAAASRWTTDMVTTSPNAANPLVMMPNVPMRSIGELGLIFDPSRYGSATLTGIKPLRTGGHTLTIGQPDLTWDGTRVATLSTLGTEMSYQVSRSRNWTAWRLADVFTVKRRESMRGDLSNPENRTEIAGLYNPNGILRDQGRVLRALFEGISFGNDDESDPALAGNLFLTTDMETILPESSRANISVAQAGTGGKAFANYLAQRLTRSVPKRFSPLWEPGEISQLDFFAYKLGNYSSTGSGGTTVQFIRSGTGNDTLNDRGREEIFRRLVDIITPKGNTFTIYVVGQTLDKQGKPSATKARRITVRLRPVFNEPLDDDFDPNNATEVTARFRRPDAYTLHIICVEGA